MIKNTKQYLGLLNEIEHFTGIIEILGSGGIGNVIGDDSKSISLETAQTELVRLKQEAAEYETGLGNCTFKAPEWNGIPFCGDEYYHDAVKGASQRARHTIANKMAHGYYPEAPITAVILHKDNASIVVLHDGRVFEERS